MATEYRMVVEGRSPNPEVDLRQRPSLCSKRNYEHAKKGVTDFQNDRESGRFDGTWNERALVYIETREVSKWTQLDMTTNADPIAPETSRPDSSPSSSQPRLPNA